MGKKFWGELFNEQDANVIVFGVPLGKHSHDALGALREASLFIEPFDVDERKNLLENIRIFDAGNLELKNLDEITDKTKEVVSRGRIPLILGGNHLLSLYSLQAFDRNTKLIVFDAHSDFKDEYEDERIREMDFLPTKKFNSRVNDATWLKRLCEKIDPKNILLIGLRSCDEFVFESIQKSDVQYFTPTAVENNLEKVRQRIKEFTYNSSVYVSVDLDAFDPSIAPAVDMPEPNGLLFKEFKKLVNSIEGKIVGMDVCCLKPLKDNQITEFLAIRAIFEILGLISRAGVG